MQQSERVLERGGKLAEFADEEARCVLFDV
jgi:hypothetical protein